MAVWPMRLINHLGNWKNYFTLNPSISAIWNNNLSEVKNKPISFLTRTAVASCIASNVLKPILQWVPINSCADFRMRRSSWMEVNFIVSFSNFRNNSWARFSSISLFLHFFQTTELNSILVIYARYSISIPTLSNNSINTSVPSSLW